MDRLAYVGSLTLQAEEHALERHCSVDLGDHEKLCLLNDKGLPANDMTVRLCRTECQDVSSHYLKPGTGKHRQQVMHH